MWGIYFYYHQKKSGLTFAEQEAFKQIGQLPLNDYSKGNLIDWEKEFYGSCITFSPWKLIQKNLRSNGNIRSIDLPKFVHREVKLFGRFVTMKKVRTKEKEAMCFCTFSDEWNVFETVFFPETYKAFSDLLFEQESYLVSGLVMNERGALQIQVRELRILDEINYTFR